MEWFVTLPLKNVPSFVLHRDQQIKLPGLGTVPYDVAFGGAFHVMLKQKISHPFESDLGFLYGTIFTGRPENSSMDSRNVCIFANGEVDRSATGTGVSTRAALHYARGELHPGEKMEIESIRSNHIRSL
jgi:trans-L-3-hydroxyproline dehydratase